MRNDWPGPLETAEERIKIIIIIVIVIITEKGGILLRKIIITLILLKSGGGIREREISKKFPCFREKFI